ncbi:hypothetical protein YSY43_40750 [Paenibacillus sp. YSY-4.3]
MQYKDKARSLAVAALLVIGITVTPPVEADHPLIVTLDGQQLKSQIEVNDGEVYAPLLPLAAELGYSVNWNKRSDRIDIVSDAKRADKDQGEAGITKQRVTDWIVEQGKEDRYYVEGLSYEMVDLDGDGEAEVLAAIDGGVHLGNFFIFDRDAAGNYRLIFESPWKVDSMNPGASVLVGDKLLYETVERTGGTGLDVEITHLWYMEQGRVVEAWKGITKEMNAMIPGSYSLTVAGYRVYDDVLYAWKTLSLLEDDAETVQGKPVTTMNTFVFDGVSFQEK